MQRLNFATAAIVASTLLSACGGGQEVIQEEIPRDETMEGCDTRVAPGIKLTVVGPDGDTSLICGSTIDLYDTGDQVVDQVYLSPDNCGDGVDPLPLAFEMEGLFQVAVIRDGYETWTSDTIEVTVPEGSCHVETNEVRAVLQPI